jgi:hypothetical protein
VNILILRFQSTAGATFRFLEVATSGFLKGTWTLCRPNVRTRDIPYVEEFAEEAKQRLFGSSAESQRFSVELSVATAIARGAFELLTSSFEELTGRPPRTVREYLETHKGFLLDA